MTNQPKRCPSVDPEQGTRCDLPAGHPGSHASGIAPHNTPASEPTPCETCRDAVPPFGPCGQCGRILLKCRETPILDPGNPIPDAVTGNCQPPETPTGAASEDVCRTCGKAVNDPDSCYCSSGQHIITRAESAAHVAEAVRDQMEADCKAVCPACAAEIPLDGYAHRSTREDMVVLSICAAAAIRSQADTEKKNK